MLIFRAFKSCMKADSMNLQCLVHHFIAPSLAETFESLFSFDSPAKHMLTSFKGAGYV